LPRPDPSRLRRTEEVAEMISKTVLASVKPSESTKILSRGLR
jgi:hypothetical protein